MSDHTHTSQLRHLHPARSEQIEAKLAARQIDSLFEPNLPIGAVREVEGNQVRLSEHRAPRQVVERYAEQMKRGAIFPAIVVNERRELIDGNTRRAAAMKTGATALPAYVCSGLTALEARSLSIELNQSHGLRMTDEEVRRFVAGSVRQGHQFDTKSCARITGAKASTIARWIAAEKFRGRASRLGVDATDAAALSEAVQVALQAARLASVFMKATELAITRRVSAAEIRTLVTRANAATTEQEALGILEADHGVRGSNDLANGATTRPRRSAGSALHMGGLLRFGVNDLLDVPPEKQHHTFAGLRMVLDLLDLAVAKASAQWETPSVAQEHPDALGSVA